MNRPKRNREVYEKGLISTEALKEIDREMYQILVDKNKKELEQAKKEFEKIAEEAKNKGVFTLLFILQFLF